MPEFIPSAPGGETPTQPLDAHEEKYGLKAIERDKSAKAEQIKAWAQLAHLEEGIDFRIIGSPEEVMADPKTILPHESRELIVLVKEEHYKEFAEYVSKQYIPERKEINPQNKYGAPKMDYSWGGRFAIIGDGITIDTAAASDVENITIPTHHEEFKNFFEERFHFEFPTSETLNPLLKEISAQGLETYKTASAQLKSLKDRQLLPDDGYGLIDEMERAIMILEDAKNGNALVDLPPVINGTMEARMRHYADLTYNAEDIKNLDRVAEITGITIPEELRIDKMVDKIFARTGFNRPQMENVCKDFADHLAKKLKVSD